MTTALQQHESQFGNVFDDLGDALSDVGDVIQDVGGALGKVVKAAAPFISLIPGVGTLAGAAIYAVAAVAAGDRIDEVGINAVEAALPANVRGVYRSAVDMGYAVARGENVGDMAVDLARKEIRAQGGEAAVAAFDTGLAVGRGKGLQDAGFKLMGAWVEGNSAGERAVSFAKDVTTARQQGKSTEDFLLDVAANQFFISVPVAKQADTLARAVQYFVDHPDELVEMAQEHGGKYIPKFDINWIEIAERAGVPVAAIRAAITIVLQMVDDYVIVKPSPERARRFVAPIMLGRSEDAATRLVNDPLAEKGRRIMADGASYRPGGLGASVTLSSVRNSSTWTGDIYSTVDLGVSANPRYQLGLPVRRFTQKVCDADWRRGFDVAIGLCEGMTAPGPGQSRAWLSFHNLAASNGFLAGQRIQHERTTQVDFQKGLEAMAIGLGRSVTAEDRRNIKDAAAKGARIAEANPSIAAARALVNDGRFRWGFDVATGVCQGSSAPGPGQTRVRTMLGPLYMGAHPGADINTPADQAMGSNEALKGFDVGQALQHGITKARTDVTLQTVASSPPNVAAGALITAGLAGSGSPVATKVTTMEAVASNPGAAQGAAAVIKEKQSMWTRFWAFFGMA